MYVYSSGDAVMHVCWEGVVVKRDFCCTCARAPWCKPPWAWSVKSSNCWSSRRFVNLCQHVYAVVTKVLAPYCFAYMHLLFSITVNSGDINHEIWTDNHGCPPNRDTCSGSGVRCHMVHLGFGGSEYSDLEGVCNKNAPRFKAGATYRRLCWNSK